MKLKGEEVLRKEEAYDRWDTYLEYHRLDTLEHVLYATELAQKSKNGQKKYLQEHSLLSSRRDKTFYKLMEDAIRKSTKKKRKYEFKKMIAKCTLLNNPGDADI